MADADPHASPPFFITRQHDWPSGRRIELAAGREAISPDALTAIPGLHGRPCYPQEWAQYADPLAAVQAAIRLQTALYHAGYGYWPLVLSSSALVQAHPIRRGAARRWALRQRIRIATATHSLFTSKETPHESND